ncbi:Fmp33p [Saccharomyces paradoxus]|uniref:Fmp33p n=1 Tax=Saccharomyces paradoxus TaxID=27291 RepID=A0A8B8UTT1_SACPA|nr:Fmp33 [Saccharomyces paradoxus]QHS74101.1 Fmp33 [Saccharomyces paradoxus]
MLYTRLLRQKPKFTKFSATQPNPGPKLLLSKGNLYTNILVTTLYGTGLACLYLESNSLNKSKKQQDPRAIAKDDVVNIVHDAPNRIFKPVLDTYQEKELDLQKSDLHKVLHSLTYSDVSQFSVVWGFLIQLSSLIGNSSLGKKSILYKGSALSVVGFPPLIYMALRLRMKQLEKAGVRFE